MVGIIVFMLYEDIRGQNRLADLRIFKQRTVLFTYIANVFFYTVFGSQLASALQLFTHKVADCAR